MQILNVHQFRKRENVIVRIKMIIKTKPFGRIEIKKSNSYRILGCTRIKLGIP